jgi:peroxiredoxin
MNVSVSEGILPQLRIGSKAPAFTLPNAQGHPHALADALARGPVLLAFFKISCPTCQYVLPFLQQLTNQLAGRAVMAWSISQDPPHHTQMFNREFGIDMPQLFDSEENLYPVSEAYGVSFVPSIFLIETDSAISHASIGFNKKEFEQIAARLAEAAGLDRLEPFPAGLDVPLMIPGCGSKN